MKFKKGQILKETGLDMSCNKVSINVTFVRYLEESDVDTYTTHDGREVTQDCVIEHDGINIISDSKSLVIHNLV